MSDPLRPVRAVVELIDAHIEQPASGSKVWALGTGGVLVQTVWNRNSIEHFEAWSPYPRVPQSVKDRMAAPYKPK